MANATSVQRRPDLDWLRILVILMVFLFHSTRFFDLEDWHVKNAVTYLEVQIWIGFASRWLMPVIFFISGASIFYALEKGGGWGRFYVDKVQRLLIPLIFGSLTHISFQNYLERVYHGQFSGSYFQFLPDYFNGLYRGVQYSGNYNFAGMHLWYLLFLFLYSLVCYRLFLWFKEGGKNVLNRICGLTALPAMTYILLPLPLLLMKLAIPEKILNFDNGGWGLIFYLWFFIAGFMVVSHEGLQDSICRQRWASLTLGVISFGGFLFLSRFNPYRPALSPLMLDMTYAIINYLCGWAWILAILGFGLKHLRKKNAFSKYANEAVLPFYILHQTVLICIGYFLVEMAVADFMKWILIFVISFTVIMTIYEGLIRRIEILRFLFGMKTTKKGFLVFRKPVPQILIVCLFFAPIALSIYAEVKNPIHYVAKIRTTSFVHQSPDFTVEVPKAWTKSYEARSRSIVLQKKSGPVDTFIVVVGNISELPAGTTMRDLPKIQAGYLAAAYRATDFRTLSEREIKLKDGTPAYEYELQWKHPQVLLYTYCIGVLKDRKRIEVAVVTDKPASDELKRLPLSLAFK